MTRGFTAFVLGGFKSVPSYPASPYVSSCPTSSPATPSPPYFYVPLNERESHGTATNGCRCTVIVAEIFQSSSAESHLALATQISTSTEYVKTPVQKLQLFVYCSPQTLHLRNSNFVASFTYNSTGITPHVSITSQHVAHNTIDKCQHVATAVAGLICNVGAFLASRLHCYFQWH